MGKGLKVWYFAFLCVFCASCASKRVSTHTKENLSLGANISQIETTITNTQQEEMSWVSVIVDTQRTDSSYWVIYDTSVKDENGKHPILAEGGRKTTETQSAQKNEKDSTAIKVNEIQNNKKETEIQLNAEKEEDVKVTKSHKSDFILGIILLVLLSALVIKIKKL